MSQPSPLTAWLKSFPKEETEIRARELERELTGLREALALHASLEETDATEEESSEDTPPKGRRDAIRRVLREGGNEPMSSTAIREAMMERGWLNAEELNRYYAAISTMTKKGGHLLRLQDGRYVLPPSKAGGDMS